MMFYLKVSHSGERGLDLEPLLLVFPCSWILLCKRDPHSGVVQAGCAAPHGSMSGMVVALPGVPLVSPSTAGVAGTVWGSKTRSCRKLQECCPSRFSLRPRRQHSTPYCKWVCASWV